MSISRTAAGLLAVCVTLTACTPGAGPDGAAGPGSVASSLAFVVGAHANSPAVDLVPEVLALAKSAVDDGEDVSVVVNAGRPEVLPPPAFAHDAVNSDAKRQEIQDNVAALWDVVRAAKAGTPESNLLGAIDTAARTLAPAAHDKTLVVVDNGLSTTAPLVFQDDGLLQAAPGDVADFLASSHALPELTGVTVMLSGIGDTAAPQAALSAAQRHNLVAIWTAVLERAGGTVQTLGQPLTGPAPAGLPAVTPVPVPAPASFAAAIHDATADKPAQVELDDRTVAFQPDRADYRDPPAVPRVLAPLAEQIVARHLTVSLTGTTASAGTAAGRGRLSLQRANAVRGTLIQLGVDPKAITATGVGSDWPGFVKDTDRQGRLMPGPAARNRKVIVRIAR
jgi:outer membrane protein OmpA-like peptidoglycan-associated protein